VEECAVHEDVRVLGEPARIERAVVRLLELARLALAPVFRSWVRTRDSVQWRTRSDDSVGPIEKERAKSAPAVGSARRSGEVVERSGRSTWRERQGEMWIALRRRVACCRLSERAYRAGYLNVRIERVLSRSSPRPSVARRCARSAGADATSVNPGEPNKREVPGSQRPLAPLGLLALRPPPPPSFALSFSYLHSRPGQSHARDEQRGRVGLARRACWPPVRSVRARARARRTHCDG
jgi:hypothetical protein